MKFRKLVKTLKTDLPPSLTIDTNLINARNAIPEMNLLEEWHKKGYVEIVKTDAMDTEMRGYGQGLAKSAKYEEDKGVGVYGQSRYGHAVYGGAKSKDEFEEVQNILFPRKKRENLNDNEIKDIMHVNTHRIYNRDYFVTNDNVHILSKKDALEKLLNVKVCTPSEIVKDLRDVYKFE